MKLYHLDPIAFDPRYCFVDVRIAVAGEIATGVPALPRMHKLEKDAFDLTMDEDAAGLELPDYVGNVSNVLPLRRSVAETFAEKFDLGEHELIPVRLINSKERVHSDEYVILNPLGLVECLDRDVSEMDGDEDDPMVVIMGQWALRSQEVPPGRDLLRAIGVSEYIFSERLVDFIAAEGLTNFTFHPVQVT